jgi:hypothetical protein
MHDPDGLDRSAPRAGARTRLAGRPHRPRLSRRGRYVALATVAVVVGSAAFDLGRPKTTADRAGDLRALVTEIRTDVASCHASVVSSFEAYTDVVDGHPSKRRAAEVIVAGNEPECTPESNSDLYDMATSEAPGSLRGFDVQSVLTDVTTWAFPQAAAAINDVDQLLLRPGDVTARADLRRRVAAMARLEGSAQRVLDAAGASLGTRVDSVDLGTADSLGRGAF